MAVPLTHLWAAALLGWAILSLAWSLDPRQGLLQTANAVTLFILYLNAHRLPVRWIAAIAATTAAALWYVIPFGGQGNPNFATELMLIGTPWLLILPVHRYVKAGALALITASILATGSNAAWPVLALAAFVPLIRRWKWTALAMPPVLAMGVWTAWHIPMVRGAMLYRIEAIWDSLVAWTHAPLFGHGFGSFVYVYPFFQEAHAWFWPSTAIGEGFLHMGASHNEPAQLLLEIGAVGAILAIGLVLSLDRKPRTPEQKAAWASLGIAGVLSLYGFPLQNPQTACIVVLALGTVAGPAIMLPLRQALPVALTVAMPPVAFLLPWLGATLMHAHFLYGEARRAWDVDPLAAWELSQSAWRVSDLDWRIRTQVPLSLRHLFDRGVPGTPISVGEGSAELAWQVGASASPKWFPILYFRAESLAAFGHLPEAYAIIDVLRTFRLHVDHAKFVASFEEQWPVSPGRN